MSFRSRITQAVLGLASFGFFVWDFPWVKRVIGALTGFDFIYEKAMDPSWLGKAFRMTLNPPPGTALLVAIVGLVLIYWNTKPKAVKMSWQVLGMLVSFICLAGFGVTYLASHQGTPVATDPSLERLTALEMLHAGTVTELNTAKQQLEAKNKELAERQTSYSQADAIQRLLLRKEQLSQFEKIYDRTAPRIKNQAEGAVRDQLDMYTKPVMLGRGRPLSQFYMEINDLTGKAKEFFEQPMQVKDPTN